MPAAGAIAFTDIVGFTEFTASQGDERAVELLDAKRSIVDGLLPTCARVVKELGDGMLLWIDDAGHALRLCAALQEAFQEASRRRPLPLWVRIGLHWGAPARRDDDLVGLDVNTAARIVDQAGPGETLVSEAVVTRCDPAAVGVGMEPIGPVAMKGLPAPVWLYRLS
jgi:class 3 adenylate cyclase